jgi:hypothetical protein
MEDTHTVERLTDRMYESLPEVSRTVHRGPGGLTGVLEQSETGP